MAASRSVPFPQGTPIDLLANLNLFPKIQIRLRRAAHDAKVLEVVLKLKHDLEALPANATDDDARKVFANLAQPLMDLSKCPDYIVNRGHYFGTSMFKEEPGLTDAGEERAHRVLENTMSGDFDYIIVGSGAGGGPLAANLAKAGFCVLVDGGGRRSLLRR